MVSLQSTWLLMPGSHLRIKLTYDDLARLALPLNTFNGTNVAMPEALVLKSSEGNAATWDRLPVTVGTPPW